MEDGGSTDIPDEAPRCYRLGAFEVDAASLVIRFGSEDCGAEAMQVRTLLALIEAHPGVVSKDALIEQVWGGRYVTDAAVHKTISLLRKLLTDRGGEELIRTRHRVGYQLVVEPRPLNVGAFSSASAAPELNRRGASVSRRRITPVSLATLATALVLAAVALFVHLGGDPLPAPESSEASLPARGDPELDAFDNARLLEISTSALPGDPELAQAAAETLLARLDAQQEPGIFGQALLQLGQVEFQRGQLAQALHQFERALPHLRRAKDDVSLALGMTRAGASLVDLGIEPDRALRLYDDALQIRQRLGDRKGEAQLRYHRSLLFTRRGQLEAARKEAALLQSLSSEVGDNELSTRAALQLADIALRAGDPDAVARFQSALDLASSAGLPSLAAAAAQRLGRLAGLAGEYPREREWMDVARRHLLAAGDASKLPIIDYGIGASFEREGLLQEAALVYRRALGALPAEPPRPLRVDLQVNLARIALTTGQGDEAERWLTSAERDARLSGSPGALATVRINQGFRELATGGSAVEALAAANEVAELLDGVENWDQERNLLTLAGLALVANEQFLEAESRVRTLREKAGARGDALSLSQADYVESVSHLLRGDFFSGYAAHRRAIGVSQLPGAAPKQDTEPALPSGEASARSSAWPFWATLVFVIGAALGWLVGRRRSPASG